MKREIVVSRYNEDLHWIRLFTEQESPHITVYNKGPDLPDTIQGVVIISVKNVGREAETYLHHIVAKWDSLAEWTVFCQGNPLSHTRMVDLINLVYHIPSEGIAGLNLCASDQLIPLQDDDKSRHNIQEVKPSSLDIYARIVKKKPTHYWSGAIFGVSQDRIRGHHLDTYKELLSTVNYHRHPEEAHILEGLWRSLFTQEQQKC